MKSAAITAIAGAFLGTGYLYGDQIKNTLLGGPEDQTTELLFLEYVAKYGKHYATKEEY